MTGRETAGRESMQRRLICGTPRRPDGDAKDHATKYPVERGVKEMVAGLNLVCH